MAKKSAVARDLKRQKLIQKYAAKRAELKELGDFEGLAKLPRNCGKSHGKSFFEPVAVTHCRKVHLVVIERLSSLLVLRQHANVHRHAAV